MVPVCNRNVDLINETIQRSDFRLLHPAPVKDAAAAVNVGREAVLNARIVLTQATPEVIARVERNAGMLNELCWNLGDAVIRRRFVLACR